MILLFADKAANVSSAAVLTLVVPLGITLIAFALWFFALRGGRRE
jgi:hypothetical protein